MMKTISVFLFCLALLGSPIFAQETAKQAEKNDSSTRLYADFLKDREGFYLQLNEEYKKRSGDSAETQNAFVKLNTNYIEYLGRNPNQIPLPELYTQAREFLDLKPQDPFAITQAYRVIQTVGTGELEEAEIQAVEKAEARMEKAKYSFEARMVAMQPRYSIFYQGNQSKKQLNAGVDRSLQLLFAVMNKKGSPESIQRVLYEEVANIFAKRDLPHGISDKLPHKIIKRFDKKNRRVKPWLKNMLLGRCHVAIAWEQRGGGYAGSVSGKGWKGFEKHIAIAQKHFEEAYRLHPERPESACQMINIAKVSDTKLDEYEWFKRATATEFDFPYAYLQMLSALRPRWGGSHEQMLKFGRRCVDTGRYDTKVPYYFIKSVDLIREDSLGHVQKLLQFKNVYPEIHEVCDNYENFFVEQGRSSFDSQQFLRCTDFAYAYSFGLFNEAHAVYQSYGGDIFSKRAMKKFGDLKYDTAVAITLAKGSDTSDLIDSIEERMAVLTSHEDSAEDTAELFQDIEEALCNTKLPKPVLFYLRTQQELVKKRVEFHKGDWVELNFTKDLRHWQVVRGNFTVEGPNSLLGTCPYGVSQYISYYTSFPPPYEIEVSVECVKSNSRSNFVHAGIICGRQWQVANGRTFWVNELRGRLGCGIPGKTSSGIDIPKKINRFRVNVFEDRYEMLIPSKTDLFLYQKDEDFVPGRVGLGSMVWLPIVAKMRYKNFRIRKINEGAPPPWEDSAAGVDYYAKRLESSESLTYRIRLGILLTNEKRLREAEQVYLECQEKYPDVPNPIWLYAKTLYSLKDYSAAFKAHREALKKCVGKYTHVRSLVLGSMVWGYATCPDDSIRNGEEAVKYANELLKELKQPAVKHYSSVAVAYAENGKFEEAIQYCDKALELVKDDNVRKSIQDKIELFKNRKPFRLE